jgi:hypothetical protein
MTSWRDRIDPTVHMQFAERLDGHRQSRRHKSQYQQRTVSTFDVNLFVIGVDEKMKMT